MLLGFILIVCGAILAFIIISRDLGSGWYLTGNLVSAAAITLGVILYNADNSKSAIISYLNGKVEVDTVSINPKTREILEIKVKFKK